MKAVRVPNPLRYVGRATFNPAFFVNRLRASWAYWSRSPVVQSLPVKLHVELTNACNLKCVMCPRGKMTRPVGFMDFDLFRRIVDTLAGRTEFAYLHLMGESLFHPRLFDCVAYGRKAGLAMGLASNMTVMDEKKARGLIDAGLDFLVMSLDGATAECYEKIRLNADFETTMANVETMLRLRRPGKPPHTVVQMITMKGTESQAAAYVRNWKRWKPDSIRLKPFQTWMGDQEGIRALDTKKQARINRPCDRIWRHSVILWDGTVVPCEFDYDARYPLGNVKDAGWPQLLNGPRMQELRGRHLEGDRSRIDLCRECDYTAPGLCASAALTLMDARMSTRLISDLGL